MTTRRGPAGAAVLLAAALAAGPACPPASRGQEAPPPRPAVMAPLADTSLLLSVTPAGEALVAVGERGHVLRSTDGGATWIQSPVPVDRLLTAVHAAPGGRLWAVGHDAVILSSDDEGRTWTLRHRDPAAEAPLLDVGFLDADRGFAVGAYGLCLATVDGGATWKPFDPHPEAPHWYALEQDEAGRLTLAGEFGILARSVDDGATWGELPSPYGGTFFGALAFGDTLLVHGLRGHVFRSADAGSTWTASDTPVTAGLLGARRLDDGRVVLVGLAGVVLVSRDGGRSFTALDRGERRGWTDLWPLDAGRVLLTGEGGTRLEDLR